MIWESSYWKEPLLTSAEYLRRVRINERTSEKTLVRIEKELFIGFYTIRKLIEARKITDKTRDQIFNLVSHKAKHNVNHMNWHHLDQNYELEQKTNEQHNLEFVCNQFIHSFLFSPLEDNGRLAGVFVSSDREKNKKCYYLTRHQLRTALRSVGNDYSSQMLEFRDPATKHRVKPNIPTFLS